MTYAVMDLIINFYQDFDSFYNRLQKLKEIGLITKLYHKDKELVGIESWLGKGCILWKKADPLTNFIMLGLALYGETFFQMKESEEAFNRLKKWWKEISKKNKKQSIKENDKKLL